MFFSFVNQENVQLQLESAYRARLAQVYQEVKKRLDYQVAVQGVYKRLEREQAINYIINEAHKSIGPNQVNIKYSKIHDKVSSNF